ncbi:heparan-alpha-glucosaminide N-acetyltransferase domain-containing protein [Scleromatobacter humisilvae]|uniref:Heparan-alpha-glucosaminide N-acetyltransferase domain-containing protein n=1 Tax=Scleromatobacter humisilvae TaxID=2897159 RepID=A0A9X1YG25_9BURK|nr:heparan-alpha-glucosaminide N-acetyltransferase domain-containing protein [Scleromatobacter humisilvae]MCK9685854.1 heparan-alpha-glucosaminide N-acetyltransferase domain-containing protein [Scleromatobacter humisilvae]
MTSAALAQPATGLAMSGRRSHQLDLFRGLAAILMIVNHAGYQLLGADAVGGGWPAWLVFVGSAAPALFFFATGVGSGLASGSGERAASALRKIVLLLLADALLNWSTGTLLGLDFFGFAAVSTATLFGVRRARRPEFVAGGLLALVLVARFGLAPLVHGRIPDDSLLAFVTGNAAVHHISYPLGPWLAFPLLGFLVGRRWRQAGSSQEAWIVGAAAVLCLALWAVLAACGAPVFRWSSVSIAYFLCAVGIVAAAWLLADRAVAALPALAQRTSLRGPASLLIVPLHYGALGVLETLSAWPWDAAAWAAATIVLVLAVFVLSRTLVSSARRLAVPGPLAQVVVAAVAVAAGLTAWELAPPLLRLEVCSAGQVVIALLLLWSSNKRGAPLGAGSCNPAANRT